MVIKVLRYMVGANFLLFLVECFWLGGDAFNGRASGGHYFLADHQRLTEVSRGVFLFCYCHALSVMITIPPVTLASLVEYKLKGGSIRDLRR
jgi:hypothetical protein